MKNKCVHVFLGAAEKNLAYLFYLASKQRTVLLIDEIDTFMSSRDDMDDEDSNSGSLLQVFLREMNKILTRKDLDIVVFGATNRPSVLPKNLVKRYKYD